MTPQGITIVGAWPRQRRSIGWDEIRRLDLGVIFAAATNPTSALVVVLHEGAPVSVRAISAEGWVRNRGKQRARVALHAAALNRRLLAARARGASPRSAVL